tara:strand:- start:47 stop:541 length:495 start_codon:yes stop_codon:yes gene_type:complete
MKNTSWNQVFAGDVVQFMYASQDGKKGNRTVICLDPKFRYKKKSTGRIVELFVGLQIDVVGRQKTLTQMELKKLIELLGESDQELERTTLNDEARLQKIYNTLKIFLRDNDVFRTFLVRECRRRRVFLLDKFADLNKLQIKNVGKQLINERRTKGELEVSEVGI